MLNISIIQCALNIVPAWNYQNKEYKNFLNVFFLLIEQYVNESIFNEDFYINKLYTIFNLMQFCLYQLKTEDLVWIRQNQYLKDLQKKLYNKITNNQNTEIMPYQIILEEIKIDNMAIMLNEHSGLGNIDIDNKKHKDHNIYIFFSAQYIQNQNKQNAIKLLLNPEQGFYVQEPQQIFNDEQLQFIEENKPILQFNDEQWQFIKQWQADYEKPQLNDEQIQQRQSEKIL